MAPFMSVPAGTTVTASTPISLNMKLFPLACRS